MNSGIGNVSGALPYALTKMPTIAEVINEEVTVGIEGLSIHSESSAENNQDTVLLRRGVSVAGVCTQSLSVQPLELHEGIVSAGSPEEALEKLMDFKPAGRELGRGSKGIVSLWKNALGAEIAIKVISSGKEKNIPRSDFFQTMNTGEINSLRISAHPNIVQCKGILLQEKRTNNFRIIQSEQNIPDENSTYFVRAILMESVNEGDLFDALMPSDYDSVTEEYKKSPALETSRSLAINVCLPLAAAVEHIHRCGFIYRDLKPENILLVNLKDGDFESIKLTDMGFVGRWKEGYALTRKCGSHEYMAPEVIGRKYSLEADLWSLGLVMLSLAMGYMPALVNDRGQIEDSDEVTKETMNSRVLVFSKLSREIKKSEILSYNSKVFAKNDLLLELLLDLLDENPDKRPTASAVVFRLEGIVAEERINIPAKKRTVCAVGH